MKSRSQNKKNMRGFYWNRALVIFWQKYSCYFLAILWKQGPVLPMFWNLRQTLFLLDVLWGIWQTTKKCVLAHFWTETYFQTDPFIAILTNFSLYFWHFKPVRDKKMRLQIQEASCLQFSDVSFLTLKGGLPLVKWKLVSFCETSGGFKLVMSHFLWNFCAFTDLLII